MPVHTNIVQTARQNCVRQCPSVISHVFFVCLFVVQYIYTEGRGEILDTCSNEVH